MASSFAYGNTRDLEFVIKEWLPLEDVLALDPYAEMFAPEDVPDLLDSMRVFAKGMLEPADEAGEAHGVKFEGGQVHVCPEVSDAYRQLQEDGWGSSNFDDDPEGYRMPRVLFAAAQEMMGAACISAMGAATLTSGVAQLLQNFGNDYVREAYLPYLLSGEWTGAACLTETTSGSDVGTLTTRALPTETPGVYDLRGNKQFISFGDHDMTENIVYCVLARVKGALPGTRGLSLFCVPKLWVEEDGSLVSNGVAPVGIEEKMGLHSMPTCRMAFGQTGQCRGWLMGDLRECDPLLHDGRGQGMAQMFDMINFARLSVGQYCVGYAANAVANAREYAKGRVQGRALAGNDAKRVPIIEHAEVRRSLLAGKAQVEAMRAMLYRAQHYLDLSRFHPDEAVREGALDWVQFSVPLCKAYPGDTVHAVAAECLQVFGGYGFCEDYPAAKILRDAKVNSIWEGTSYMQARDLVDRKFRMKGGALFGRFRKLVDELAEASAGVGECTLPARAVQDAAVRYDQLVEALAGMEVEMRPTYLRRVLEATARLYAAALLVDQARLAADKLAQGCTPQDETFYRGKLAVARFFAANELPFVASLADQMAQPDATAVDVLAESLDY